MSMVNRYDHGTPNGYNRGCREACCRGARAEYERERRANQKKIGARSPELIPHGTLAGWTCWGCREACCEIEYVRAQVRYLRNRRAREAAG